jgi:hypothetical protein
MHPRIAYLILAHHEPEHARRLVDALSGTASSIHLHVDRKTDVGGFERALTGARVNLLRNRESVWHTGYSSVRAMLALLHAAFTSGTHDYYVLLSGDDYPLKSDAYILRFFSGTRQGFIGHYAMNPGRLDYERLAQKRYPDFFLFNRRWARRHGIPKQVAKKLEQLVLLPFTKPRLEVQCYRGSQWWALPHSMAAYVLEHMSDPSTKPLRRFFTLTSLSEEMVIQTVLLNSLHGPQCVGFERSGETYDFITPLHYIDWDPGRECPALLRAADWEKMRASPCLFARKLTGPGASDLLRLIEAHRGGRTAEP